ncbi:hypothetical protein FPV67DRAFT_1454421 [Lyophyllum atratum]|nr:hypothetical protein FPV67DRAFT_1454421 [Lyophyllum atratum]
MDESPVSMLVHYVEQLGGASETYFGPVYRQWDFGPFHDHGRQKMRIKVSPANLDDMIKILLMVGGWKDMALHVDVRSLESLGRIMIDEAGSCVAIPRMRHSESFTSAAPPEEVFTSPEPDIVPRRKFWVLIANYRLQINVFSCDQLCPLWNLDLVLGDPFDD